MSLTNDSTLRNVSGITEHEKELIKAFMQGAIYSWIRDRQGEVFAVHDLAGGKNWQWQGTPLLALYEKHIQAGKDVEAAYNQAAIDLGWLVKSVLAEDKRVFTSTQKGLVSGYSWTGEETNDA
jgi:hypothetical protein